MKKLFSWLWPKKSQWFDIGMFESSGKYKLIQMRLTLHTNRKQFRTVSLGWVNDYTQREKIYSTVLSINSTIPTIV